MTTTLKPPPTPSLPSPTRPRGVRDADRRLLRDLERGELAAGTFHHRQHVQAAWTLLHEDDLPGALRRFGAALRRFTRRAGVPELYHETITWLFVFLINERIARLPAGHSWEEFARTNADLLTDHRGLLRRYYSPERLASPLAKASFLIPDRCPAASAPAGAD